MIMSNETFHAMDKAGLIDVDLSGVHWLKVTGEEIRFCNHIPEDGKPIVLDKDQVKKLGEDDLNEVLYFGQLELIKFRTMKELIKQEVADKVYDDVKESIRSSL